MGDALTQVAYFGRYPTFQNILNLSQYLILQKVKNSSYNDSFSYKLAFTVLLEFHSKINLSIFTIFDVCRLVYPQFISGLYKTLLFNLQF